MRAFFRTRQGEALVVGASVGFVLFLVGVNLLTNLLTLPGASLASAAIILAAGLAAVRFRRLDWPSLRADLSSWPQLLILLILALFFTNAKRGISLFDDYVHQPLVSIMGAGDIPPHFYVNPSTGFAYHYGLQIFAAVLERIAAFFPWSAWDLGRGIALGFTFLLGWLWVRRFTHSGTCSALGSFLYMFGGGTRWLLLLLPGSVLAWASRGVQLSSSGLLSGSNLAIALTRPFVIEGQGAMPFPFAYRNGNFEAVFFNLGNTGALMFLTVLVLLLLSQTAPSIRRPGSLVVYTLVFASLALSAEYLFALWWGAIVLEQLARFALRSFRRLRLAPVGRDELLGWAFILGFSALLSIVQGGYITETFRSLLPQLAGGTAATSNVYSFALRWPPGILDGHLGELSLLDPRQLLVLLFELGPVLLLAPLATRWAWKTARMGQTWQASLGLAAWFSMLFTVFFEYGVDRRSTRFSGTALWLWLVLAFPAIAYYFRSYRPVMKVLTTFGYGATVFAGLVIFAIQITSVPTPITTPVATYFISPLDSAFTRQFWNQLEPGAQVFDNFPERAVTVFARASTARSDVYAPLPAWSALVASPDPYRLRAFGFSYAYIAKGYWDGLPPLERQKLTESCVKLVQEKTDALGDYRKLLDIRGCQR